MPKGSNRKSMVTEYCSWGGTELRASITEDRNVNLSLFGRADEAKFSVGYINNRPTSAKVRLFLAGAPVAAHRSRSPEKASTTLSWGGTTARISIREDEGVYVVLDADPTFDWTIHTAFVGGPGGASVRLVRVEPPRPVAPGVPTEE